MRRGSTVIVKVHCGTWSEEVKQCTETPDVMNEQRASNFNIKIDLSAAFGDRDELPYRDRIQEPGLVDHNTPTLLAEDDSEHNLLRKADLVQQRIDDLDPTLHVNTDGDMQTPRASTKLQNVGWILERSC